MNRMNSNEKHEYQKKKIAMSEFKKDIEKFKQNLKKHKRCVHIVLDGISLCPF
jgi:hypothetical protein